MRAIHETMEALLAEEATAADAVATAVEAHQADKHNAV
jgi:hypothetical protein